MVKKQNENDLIPIRISRAHLHRQILSQLLKQKQVRTIDLSQGIGLEVSDLTPALNFLERKGFIHQSSLEGAVDQNIISLREGENCVIGLDLGGTKLYGAISDLAGQIFYDEEIQNHGKSGEACLDMIIYSIQQLLDESKKRNLKVVGIGIDVPGRVQLETGFVIRAPAVSMVDFPLKDRLASRFDYPIFIDNDLKQASLGEAWFGAGKNYRNAVLVAIGTGIAASTVIDGALVRGAHLRYGEIGWMVPGREFLGKRYVGFGAFESEASGPGIENRAKKLINESLDQKKVDELTASLVFSAAKSGEEWAEKCIQETIEYLALMIANIMAFYDPDIIILSGGVSISGKHFIPQILKLVEGCVLTQPNIVLSTLGYKAGVLGAIINLIQNCPEFIL